MYIVVLAFLFLLVVVIIKAALSRSLSAVQVSACRNSEGAGAATIVSVLIAALIVTIDITQASVAGVVVITAAAREAKKHNPKHKEATISARSCYC